MSFHLTEQAARIKLPASLKLALMCFADSGSNQGRVAMPGLDGVMTWCGVEKSQALNLIKQLQELRLLELRRHGHRGRRSEYVVFPDGCCAEHGKRPAAVEAGSEKGSDTSDPLPTSALSTASDTSDPLAGKGSDVDAGKGPICTPERVRRSRSNQEPSQRPTPTDMPPVSYETGPVTSRATDSEPSIDFTVVDLRQPDPAIAGPCGECEKGWVIGNDGTPLSRCPQCHPGYQRTEGATA